MSLDPDESVEQHLSDFFDHAPVGLHLQSQDGTIRKANRALLDLLGYEPEECVGRNWSEFTDDHAAAADVIDRLSDGQTLSSHEITLRAKDGSVRHALLSANVLWREASFVHARCFTRDITRLKQAQFALIESDRQKAAILNASLDAILTMDAKGMLVDFNHAAEQIFGYRRSDAIGRPLAELIIPLRLRQMHADGLRRYLETGEERVIGRRVEIDALHAQGHEFPVELSIAVVDGADALFFTATLRDISERKAAETLLLDADRAKDEFIAALAHELRNPLAPMRNAVLLLSNAGLPRAKQEWALGILHRQISHMARLLDDLLDAARISHGKVALRIERVELQEVVRSAVEVAQPVIDEKEQPLSVVVPATPVMLHADPVRLAQVLSNLLVNASKYSAAGSPITVRAEAEEDVVRVEVADKGFGLSAGELGQLFTMFTQLPGPPGTMKSGLGIGLALSRSLVEMHKGTLVARSQGHGCGSTFVVTLPR